MISLDYILVASLGLVAFSWAGYPLLVFALARLFPRNGAPSEKTNDPLASIIIPVHNEQQRIAAKLEDCLKLVYPRDRLEIIVVSDGSIDRTEEIVRSFVAADPRIRWLQSSSRVGKSGAQNLAVAQAHGDLLLFTDANTILPPGVLRVMADGFADPGVGMVVGTVRLGTPKDAIEKGQGFYWRYELFLRSAESQLGILATGSGQALLVRRELFRALPTCYGDDCIMPLDVRLQGYRVVQNPDPIVFDTMPHSIEGELRARIRMTARNWSGTLSRPAILNPLRFPLTALGLLSHKLLRWLTPFFLAMVLFSSGLLALGGRLVVLWWLQVAFYVSAAVGWELTRRQRPAWVFGYPFSFCLANIGFMLGMVRVLRNQKIVAY